jgi:hypothetical protein
MLTYFLSIKRECPSLGVVLDGGLGRYFTADFSQNSEKQLQSLSNNNESLTINPENMVVAFLMCTTFLMLRTNLLTGC